MNEYISYYLNNDGNYVFRELDTGNEITTLRDLCIVVNALADEIKWLKTKIKEQP